MERIIVHIEGDIEARAKEEMVSPDQIIATLSEDIENIAQSFGLSSYVNDTYFVDGVRYDNDEPYERGGNEE